MSHIGPNIAEAFWDNVSVGPGCWEWLRATAVGYGVLWVNNRLMHAHRFAWQFMFGAIPNGLRVLHRCDNPGCVRPDHLWLGTAADNSRDMVAKGRMAQQKDPSRIARGPRKRAAA